MNKEQFSITGMTCSACAARVEKAVAAVDGVEEVAVNLLKNSMVVSYSDNCDTKTIIGAVRAAGYGASTKNTMFNNAETKSEEDTSLAEYNGMKKRLALSLVFALPLFYISMGHMMGWPLPPILRGTENALIFAFTQFLLLLPVVFINAAYYKNGFKTLFSGAPNMDSLISIGSGVAIVYGIYALYKIAFGLGHGDLELVNTFMMDLYFESAAMILTLITLGKTLESRAKRKTSDAITKLMNLTPKTATVERGGAEIMIPTSEVVIGDIVIVKAGESIAADGTITQGNGTVDESALTGESIPVEKHMGDMVIGATVNKSGYFKFRAEKVGENTALAQIIKLVDNATASKAPVAKLADKVSAVFVPTVISLAIIAAIVWLVLGYGVEFSLSIAISVLVISCPCALGLATPTAIMVGMGKGASCGILIKNADALETAGGVNTVVFDKTGTITEGTPAVTDIFPSANANSLLYAAATLEKSSEHPIATAIIKEAKNRGINIGSAINFKQFTGLGVSGNIDGDSYLIGNKRLMEENDISTGNADAIGLDLSVEGKTTLFVAKNKTLVGIIAVADTVKKNSRLAVERLTNMGIEVIMLTGDNSKTAKAIAKQVGDIGVIAEVLPDAKEAEIRRLQESGKKVAMVGDGINDAPALARADVGIAIGAGTDIAIESADIVLMKSDLTDVPNGIRLSRATMRNIKQNLFWAFIYNIIGIPVAAGALYIPFALKLNPMLGALSMSFSSVFVVTNALRLKSFKFDKTEDSATVNEEPEPKTEYALTEKVLTVKGMTCGHCSAKVQEALLKIDGVRSAQVSLLKDNAKVVITKDISDTEFKNAIKNAGFNLTEIQ